MRETPLSTYLKQTGQSQRAFAAHVGVREATISEWATGKVIPGPSMMALLAEKTDGVITPNSWFPDMRQAGDAA